VYKGAYGMLMRNAASDIDLGKWRCCHDHNKK